MSRAPWWTGIPPLEATVACGPGHHRLRWEEGRLRALDHPDPAAEEVLARLLEETPPCLALVEQWRAHAADPAVLAVGSRHPGDSLALGADDQTPLRTAAPPAAGGAAKDRAGLLQVLALPAGLQRRLQAEVAAALTGQDAAADPMAASMLEAATLGRLAPIARRWAGGRDLELTVAGGRGRWPAPNGAVRLEVGPAWLPEVWSRYLGAVDGFLVLEVHRIVEDRAEVSGLGAPGVPPARLLLTGPAPWRVRQRLDT